MTYYCASFDQARQGIFTALGSGQTRPWQKVLADRSEMHINASNHLKYPFKRKIRINPDRINQLLRDPFGFRDCRP